MFTNTKLLFLFVFALLNCFTSHGKITSKVQSFLLHDSELQGLCKCDNNMPGSVYAWWFNDQPILTPAVKIGCTGGETHVRIKAEVSSALNYQHVRYYECSATVNTPIDHTQKGRVLEDCNALERHTHYSLGGSGQNNVVNKPARASDSGKTEWFAITPANALLAIQNQGGVCTGPHTL